MEFLFNPKKEHGKDKLFKDWGITIEDSKMLRAIYLEQAKEKYGNGDYQLSHLNDWGQTITIDIELTDKIGKARYVKTAWMVEPFGQIRLVTPYAGK